MLVLSALAFGAQYIGSGPNHLSLVPSAPMATAWRTASALVLASTITFMEIRLPRFAGFGYWVTRNSVIAAPFLIAIVSVAAVYLHHFAMTVDRIDILATAEIERRAIGLSHDPGRRHQKFSVLSRLGQVCLQWPLANCHGPPRIESQRPVPIPNIKPNTQPDKNHALIMKFISASFIRTTHYKRKLLR